LVNEGYLEGKDWLAALPGFLITEQLYESGTTCVVRALRAEDRLPVVIKYLKDRLPFKEDMARLIHEAAMTRRCDAPGVSKVVAVLENGLVFEDSGGIALSRVFQHGTLAANEFLSLAVKITEALGQVHQYNILHRDINPSNLLYNQQTGQVKIIDFGLAVQLDKLDQDTGAQAGPVGTFAYMPPEQTGRVNQAVDQRSDLYALGVTFFELLAGEKPFQGQDMISLVHEQIAVVPRDLRDINPQVPGMLAVLVAKLLAKNPDDRYQSCAGLQADLGECLRQLQQSGAIQDFVLGRWDSSAQLRLPNRLYGREQEIDQLLGAYTRIAAGELSGRLALIDGEAGIGKSALLEEVRRQMVQRGGHCAAGKFDRLQRNIPYSAFIQAFRTLVHQILSESPQQIETWRASIQAAVGDNGRVILDVIPDLKLILGDQPPIAEAAPVQAQVRYRLTIQNFIRVFTTPAHPLVLILDDLQWSDHASLDLFEFLATAVDQRYLLMIGAYRETDTGDLHPLRLSIRQIERLSGPVQRIVMSPLQLDDITRIISDTLKVEETGVYELALLVKNKTDGNPFYIAEFLRSLAARRLLTFDARSGWHWDIEQILAEQITGNVADLVMRRIDQLPEADRKTLSLAACLGSQFSSDLLDGVAQAAGCGGTAWLWRAVSVGLLIQLNPHMPDSSPADRQPALFSFAHDRIHAAIYEQQLSSEERTRLHRVIGEYLLANTPAEQRIERIFDIASHLNLGGEPGDRCALAEINLQAGKQAKKSAAFKPAYDFLKQGLQWVQDNGWQENYPLTLELAQQNLDVAYACGLLDDCAVIMEEIFRNSRSQLDQISARQVQIRIYAASNRSLQALQLALEALKPLGVQLPANPAPEDVSTAFARLAEYLEPMSTADLVNLPVMTDPDKLAAMSLLTSTTTAAFNSLPRLYALIAFERVRLSVEYGNSPMSPAAYAAYGLYLCGQDEYEEGYQFGRLALDLADRLDALQYKARTIVTACAFIQHWRDPLQSTLAPLYNAYKYGLQAGDAEFATSGLVTTAQTELLCGVELNELREHFHAYLAAVRPLMHHRNLRVMELHLELANNLLEPVQTPDHFVGHVFDEDQMMPLMKQGNDQYTLFHIYFYKAFLSCLFNRPERALDHLQMTEAYLDVVRSKYVYACFYFYQSLTLLDLYAACGETERRSIMAQVVRNQQRYGLWARVAPANHANKYWLVEAEHLRVQGLWGEAREAYDKAVDLSHQSGFIHEKALACERAAQFYLERGQTRWGNACLQDAYLAYQQWGCKNKARQMEEKYPEILTNAVVLQPRSGFGSQTSTKNGGETLDLLSLLKASQALSGEIVLKTLMLKLMSTIIENAGAQKGYLLLEREGQWLIEASGMDEPLQSRPAASEPLLLSAGVMNYVLRTGEALVLDNAHLHGGFERDAYLAINQVRSLLCMPLRNQNKLIGLLYLENNLVAGAFTPQRLEFLRVLSAQAAISIENARFYELLEHKVAERTRELQAEVQLRREAEEQAKVLAITDPLTGLYNRRFFFSRLEEEILRSRRYKTCFGLIMLDIDYFKRINDRFGHLAGDQVLKGMAEKMRACYRDVDILARYGGEEMIMLLPETRGENARLAAERLRSTLENTLFGVGSDEIHITASLGVAVFTGEETIDSDQLVERADQALYRAKAEGRNRVRCYAAAE